jgi:translation initiation factor IF-3
VHSATKEVRLRPRIATHDYAWKRDQAITFLRSRSRVKLIVMFRGREREHPELGRQLLARLTADVAEFGHLDGRESFEGRSMTVLLSPNGGGR